KIFGSKSERDIKQIMPIVEKVKAEFAKLSGLTNDELRAKTAEFKSRIAEHLAEIDAQIAEISESAEDFTLSMEKKTELYERVDKLKKERDEQLEVVLNDILPEAFAVVKETARRLSENTELEVTAQDFDRELASTRTHIRIEGDKAYWKNSWIAAG